MKTCEEKKLAIYNNGWCSFYDATQGFDACYSQGLCGVCADSAMRGSIFFMFAVVISMVVTQF